MDLIECEYPTVELYANNNEFKVVPIPTEDVNPIVEIPR